VSPFRSRSTWLWVAAGLTALALGCIGLARSTNSSDREPRGMAQSPVFRLDADHATYPSVDGIAGAASLIVRGTVISHTTEAGVSPGVDALGDPLPAIPHTNYLISILTTLKGSAPGGNVVASLSGGTTEAGKFVLDGAPEIVDGGTYIFFLGAQGEGKYYPLAGGAAVAAEQPDGSFALPADATGAAPLVFTQAEVPASATPQPAGSLSQGAPPSAAAPGRTRANRARCRRHFHQRRVHGKKRCVKVKKHPGHRGTSGGR
jgi:hypothetical protein